METRRRRERKARESRQPGILSRAVNDWWNRLIGAVFGGKLSEQTEQYLPHQTKRDYVCNTVGPGGLGHALPRAHDGRHMARGRGAGGLFSMAFTVGTLLLFLANYGVRTYQVSDLDDMRSFRDYQIQRFATCAAMLLVGWLWCRFRGYDAQMFAVCMGVLVFRAVDGLADVYEGAFSRRTSSISPGSRRPRAASWGSWSSRSSCSSRAACPWRVMPWLLGRGVASAAHRSAGLLRDREEPPATARGIRDLFVECFPLFLALFLYNLIDSVPKFAMEGALSYDNQLYYNALYFPAHSILMVAGFIYKPQLVRLARIWDDPRSTAASTSWCSRWWA